MLWRHVICRPYLADMGDTRILWLNELQEWHVTSCCMSSTELLGDVFCCLFLSRVVMQQKNMLTWHHIRHVGDMSWNVTCRWRCHRQSCYSDIWQFLLSSSVSKFYGMISGSQGIKVQSQHCVFQYCLCLYETKVDKYNNYQL